MATILAAGDLALVFLELPTGRFADRFGHRASLIVGSLVQVAGMLCCWLGHGIPALAAASVLVALGDAFRSGADQVILAALGALVLAAGLARPSAFLFAVFALSFLVGVALPLRAAAIQRLATDGVRAQAASAASPCDMAISTIVLPAVGLWRNRA